MDKHHRKKILALSLFLPGKKMIEQMVCSETAAFGKKLVCKIEYILQPTKM